MKKILIILYSIFLYSIYNITWSDEHSNIKKYYTLNNHVSKNLKIIEFFSFYCPYCYEFEKKYHIKHLIKKKLIDHVKIYTYHVNFLGGQFSQSLTKAWIIAQKMRVEEQIIMPIFYGIQKTNTIKNNNDIKDIFLKNTKITLDQYNQLWNSFTIQILLNKNKNTIKKMNVDHIPMMLINNKYIIDYYNLELLFKKEFSKKFLQLINFLISKDKKTKHINTIYCNRG